MLIPVFTDFTHNQNVNIIAKMATASLSYEPATERETYPGTKDTKNAANNPAFDDQHSFVNKYVTIAVNPANIGAVNTQNSRIFNGIFKKL